MIMSNGSGSGNPVSYPVKRVLPGLTLFILCIFFKRVWSSDGPREMELFMFRRKEDDAM